MTRPEPASRADPKSGLVRRAPFLLVALLGILLWRSSLFPQQRELIWRVPPNLGAQSVEIQLWKDGVLLKREQRSGAALSPGDWSQTLSVREGSYRAEVFVQPLDGGVLVHARHPVEFAGSEALRLPLLAR